MITVYKYTVMPLADPQGHHVPVDSSGEVQILHFGEDGGGELCYWALVDTDWATKPATLWCLGTGWTFPDDLAEALMLGTAKHVQSTVGEGGLVWHLFIKS